MAGDDVKSEVSVDIGRDLVFILHGRQWRLRLLVVD